MNKDSHSISKELDHTDFASPRGGSYLRWLIKDQAQGLLNMSLTDIAKAMGANRTTLWQRLKDGELDKFSIKNVDMLEAHIRLVKACLLTTEGNHEY